MAASAKAGSESKASKLIFEERRAASCARRGVSPGEPSRTSSSPSSILSTEGREARRVILRSTPTEVSPSSRERRRERRPTEESIPDGRRAVDATSLAEASSGLDCDRSKRFASAPCNQANVTSAGTLDSKLAELFWAVASATRSAFFVAVRVVMTPCRNVRRAAFARRVERPFLEASARNAKRKESSAT